MKHVEVECAKSQMGYRFPLNTTQKWTVRILSDRQRKHLTKLKASTIFNLSASTQATTVKIAKDGAAYLI